MEHVVLSSIKSVPKMVAPKAVMMFVGDQLPDTLPPEILQLQDPTWQLRNLQQKFPDHHHFYIIFPARLESGFSCYDQYLAQTTKMGEPAMGYRSTPAMGLKELFKTLDTNDNWRQYAGGGGSGATTSTSDKDACIFTRYCSASPVKGVYSTVDLVGFSKGGVVLNQILAEMSRLSLMSSGAPSTGVAGGGVAKKGCDETATETIKEKAESMATNSSSPFTPLHKEGESTPEWEEMLLFRAHRHIRALHYVDCGLNTRGAYVAQPRMLNALSAACAKYGEWFANIDQALAAMEEPPPSDEPPTVTVLPLYMTVVSTWRQCDDPRRPWITEEHAKFCHFLKHATPNPIPLRATRVAGQAAHDNVMLGLRTHMESQREFDPTFPSV